MQILAILAALLLCTGVEADEPSGYARPELLVEPNLLMSRFHGHEKEQFSQAGVQVIDVRPKSGRDADAHPLGVWVDVAEWKTGFGDGEDLQAWSRRISGVLNHPAMTVVVVDDAVTPTAARMWWMLKYWGVKDVRILNGGYRAWRAEYGDFDLKLISHVDALPDPKTFEAKPQSDRLAKIERVRRAIADERATATCLVDTRTDREWKAGAIPAARHSDWTRYVDATTGKLKSAAELRRLLAGAGFDPKRPAVTYCQSGGRASVVAFAMELMGGERVANYWGSWGEWSKQSRR